MVYKYNSMNMNECVPVSAVHPQRREAGEHPDHQTAGHQTLRLRIRPDTQ